MIYPSRVEAIASSSRLEAIAISAEGFLGTAMSGHSEARHCGEDDGAAVYGFSTARALSENDP